MPIFLALLGVAAIAYVAFKSPVAKAEAAATGLIEAGTAQLAAMPSVNNGLLTMPLTERDALYRSLPNRTVNKMRDDDGQTEILILEDPGTLGVLNAMIAVYGGNMLTAPGEKGPFSFLIRKDDATGKTLLMASRQGFESKYAGFMGGQGWEVFLLPAQAKDVAQATGTALPAIPTALGL